METIQDETTEQQMFERYAAAHDKRARDAILEKYLYIAEIIAKKFVGRGVEYDDLYQVASLALIKAVERFEPERGVKFASFATPTLVGEIKNYFRDKTRMIRISRRDSEMIRHLDEARETLAHNNGHGVTPEEIAEYLGISVERVLELMETQSAAYAASLDSCLAVSEDLKLVKLIGTSDSEFDRIEDRDFLDRCFERMNDIERRVIEERYIGDKSQREVAAGLGVSQMYISRIERRILDKFRNYYEN